MDCTTDGIVLQAFHLQTLVYNALSRDCCVSMNDNRNDCASVLLLPAQEVLLGSDSTLDAWIDGFQVRGVRHQGQLDLVACISIGSLISRAQMVLNIT